ncbi:MAG: kynureninase [Xanthomonadales bacterium]|nr:kynureninase [Xanthomonadales bacterium]
MSSSSFRQLDAVDPLASLRDLFDLPRDKVYLDGNSLGALPRAVHERISQFVQQEWGQDLISSWNKHNWIDLPGRVGEKIASLVGAAPGQVICADSISVNLFKLLSTALALRPGRKVIVSQQDNFPTDLYMGQGLAGLLGPERCQLRMVSADRLLPSLDEDVAVLMLTQVNFRDGCLHDMADLTEAAHAQGALVLWDLAHSAGVMPVELDRCGVDMAVGCGYKFLNGGPGAPAFLYLARRHQDRVNQALSGWMGHKRAFEFEPDYEPAQGVQRYLAGTPGILGMVALDTALDVFEGVSLGAIRKKSLALGQCFIDEILARDMPDVTLLTPRQGDQRGSQVSLAHPQAFALSQALIHQAVIVDFRAPDIIRFGFSPLYNRFEDIDRAVSTLAELLRDKGYLDARFSEI